MQIPEAGSPVWKTSTFVRINHLLGRSRAQVLLSDYVDHLSRAMVDIGATPVDTKNLRRTLHELTSISGMLGFEALASMCLAMLSDDAETPTAQQITCLQNLASDSREAARHYIGSVKWTAA